MIELKNVKARAKQLGAKVEDDKCGNTHECRVEAPHRKVWRAFGCHEIIDCTNRPWKPDYADILNSMDYGLDDCIDNECDWCNNS